MSQYWIILRQGLLGEFSNKERLVSPLLFAATFLLLFSFAIGELDPVTARRIFVAQAFLGVFFALEIVFSRVFEPDLADRVFDLMRTYPVSPMAWFAARYSMVVLIGAALSIPTLLLASLFSGVDVSAFDPVLLSTVLLALAGLASIGVLISALVLSANAKQILYPLLYFPLTTPVLLGAVNACLHYLEARAMTDTVWKWFGLLLGFDVIYGTLGVLLFSELVETR